MDVEAFSNIFFHNCEVGDKRNTLIHTPIFCVHIHDISQILTTPSHPQQNFPPRHYRSAILHTYKRGSFTDLPASAPQCKIPQSPCSCMRCGDSAALERAVILPSACGCGAMAARSCRFALEGFGVEWMGKVRCEWLCKGQVGVVC